MGDYYDATCLVFICDCGMIQDQIRSISDYTSTSDLTVRLPVRPRRDYVAFRGVIEISNVVTD